MTNLKNNFGSRAGIKLASSFLALTSSLAAQQVFAQDDDDDVVTQPEPGVVQEQVIVQGVRQSLQNAQDIKRDADTFVDAISAQDIGSLPDRSVLEAMQRLPGVSIERFAAKNDPDHFSAEGSGAVIRGMTFTRTEFNGRDSFTANSGRGLSFQDVPPELMSSVRLYKNQSADMIEGGIGGTVSLHTRVPFDQSGQLIAFSGDTTYYDLNEKWSPSYSGLYSNRWEMEGIGEVGFLVGFADSHSDSRSDGIQSEIFQERRFNGQEVLVPNGSNVSMKEDNRVREGTTVAFQWADEDETMLATATYLKSDSSLSWNENKISYQGDVINAEVGSYQTTSMADTTFSFDDEGVFSYGVLANGGNDGGWRAGGNDANRIPNRGNLQIDDATVYSTYDELPVSACTDADTSNDPDNCNELADTFGNRFQTTARVKYQRTVVEDTAFNFKFTPSEEWEFVFDYQYVEATTSDDDMEIYLGMVAMQEFDLRGDVPSLRLVNPWTNAPEETINNPDLDDGSIKLDRDYFIDPSAYWWKSAMDHYERAYGEEEAVRFDVTRSFDDPVFGITAVKAGVRSSTREQEVRWSQYNWGALAEIWTSDFDGDGYNAAWLDLPISESLSDGYEAVDWSSFNRGESFFVPGSMPNHVLHPSRELAEDYANWGTRLADVSHPDQWVPAAQRDLDNDGQFDTDGHFLPSELSDIKETNNAAYVRFDFEGDIGGHRIDGNFGVRYFEVELESAGFVQFPDVRPEVTDVNDPEFLTDPGNFLSADEVGFGNAGSIFSVAEHSYDHILPSFNIKFEINDDLLARAAVSKAVALPDIGILRNYMRIGVEGSGPVVVRSGGVTDPNDTIQEQSIESAEITGWVASAGNPFLEPMESIQYDLSLEWYFADVGSLTASVFYKDLSNFFLDGAYPRVVTNETSGVTDVVNVDGTINTGDGELGGFELAYQQFYDFLPEPWDGLGIQMNYTYIDAKSVPNRGLAEQADLIPDFEAREARETEVTYGGLPLESQSKHTANLVGMWEKGDWSVRFAYNWRSRYLVTARDVINPYRPIWSDDAGYLDASLFYNLTDEIKIGLQGTNLADTVTKTEMQIAEDGYTQGRSWFTNDRRYALVLRAQF